MLDYYLNVNKKFNLFQGFIECNENKVPIKGTYFGNHKQATDSSENIQGILNEGIVLIDIDTATEGELYLNYLKKCNVNTLIVKTTRGYHFYFKSNDIIKNTTHNLSILGITFDIKNSNGGKLSTATIKVNNKFREIIDEPTTELPKLPFYFEYAILNRNDFYKEKLTNVLTATDGSYLNTEFIDLCKKYKYKYIDKSFNFLNKHFFNNSIERIVDIDNIFNDSIKNTNFSNNTKFISNINKPSLIDYASKVLTQSKNGFYECPFCGSGRGAHRTGAFKVYTDTNRFYCFSCHKSGDFYTLYMYLNNVDFKTAYNTFNKKIFDNKFLLLKNFRFSNYDYFLLWIHSLLTCNSQLLLKYNLIKTDNIQPTENSIITTDTTEFIDNLKLLTYKNNLIYHSINTINNTINDNTINDNTIKGYEYLHIKQSKGTLEFYQSKDSDYNFNRDLKILSNEDLTAKYKLPKNTHFKQTEYKNFYTSDEWIFNPELKILYCNFEGYPLDEIVFKTCIFRDFDRSESLYCFDIMKDEDSDYIKYYGYDYYVKKIKYPRRHVMKYILKKINGIKINFIKNNTYFKYYKQNYKYYDFNEDIKNLTPTEYNKKYNLFNPPKVFTATEYKNFYKTEDGYLFNPVYNILYYNKDNKPLTEITFNSFSENNKYLYNKKITNQNFMDYMKNFENIEYKHTNLDDIYESKYSIINPISNCKISTYNESFILYKQDDLTIYCKYDMLDYIPEGTNNNYDFARDIKLLKPREYNQKYNLYKDYVFKPTKYKNFYESNDYRIIFNPNLNILYENNKQTPIEQIIFKTNTFINSNGEEFDYSIKLATCNFSDYLTYQGLEAYNHKALHKINMLFSFDRIGDYFISKDKTILYNPLNNTYVKNIIKFDKYTHFSNEEMSDEGINLMLKNGFYYDNKIYFLFNPRAQIKLNYDDFRDYETARNYLNMEV